MTATLIELGCDPRTLNTVDCINHKRCVDKDGYGTIKIAGKVYGVLPMSRQFGVSTTAIRYARDGKNWKLL